MSSKKRRKRGISRLTDVQTAWSTYSRGLRSYFTTWRQKSWFCLTANFKMNLRRVCSAPQISLGDISYLCHTPSRERDAGGCSLYWEDVLMVITSLVFPPFSILSTILSLTFFGCHIPQEEGSHLLWIIPCSESNVTTQTCSRVNTGIRKWWQQTNCSCWQKQRHPLELNMFDSYENVHIQEKAMKHTHRIKSMLVK